MESFIAGPAGTGKSSLCGSLKEWYTKEGMNVAIVVFGRNFLEKFSSPSIRSIMEFYEAAERMAKPSEIEKVMSPMKIMVEEKGSGGQRRQETGR